MHDRERQIDYVPGKLMMYICLLVGCTFTTYYKYYEQSINMSSHLTIRAHSSDKMGS